MTVETEMQTTKKLAQRYSERAAVSPNVNMQEMVRQGKVR
jgi:hypothetical protein